jgi:SulP family sulfate permease
VARLLAQSHPTPRDLHHPMRVMLHPPPARDDLQVSEAPASPHGGGTERSTRSVRRSLRHDSVAGVVLGVESVPDGLAAGLLANVNPVAGLYAYLFGTAGGALLTSTPYMAVQATGAMAIIVADVDLASRPDPDRALSTLSVLTGVVMVAAGLLRFGTALRFVPTAVMVGFISAVGVNIVLGQLDNLTGYDAEGASRLLRTLDLLLHPWRIEPAALAVGLVTIALVVLLTRTRVGALGLVVAIVAGSVLAAVLTRTAAEPVALVRDIADVPNALPAPVLPTLGDVAVLLVPAVSLAFVGLVQGAAVSAGYPPPGRRPDTDRDFIGQGAGNLAAGLFQGMPVGGSMSGSSLAVTAGARTRLALLIASAVMAVVILLLADVVALVALPALAGLLMVVGVRTVKPSRIHSVVRSSLVQAVILTVTFALTVLIPLQYAVLVGVGLALVLFVVRQSNSVSVRRLVTDPDGRTRETDPPATLGAGEVVVLQPYGSLFFASAPVFESRLPAVGGGTDRSVVVLRLRGIDRLGLGIVDVLRRYQAELAARGSRLVVVAAHDGVVEQLRRSGLADEFGPDGVYHGSEWIGETVARARDDARRWVKERS